MTPVQFAGANAVLGADQEEYEPLPVHRGKPPEYRVTFCTRLSDAEIDEIVRTRTLWLQQLTFGNPFQPVGLSTQKPDGLP